MYDVSSILQAQSILAPLSSLLRKKSFLQTRILGACKVPAQSNPGRAFYIELSLRLELLNDLEQQLYKIHHEILQHPTATHENLQLSQDFTTIVRTKTVINLLINNPINSQAATSPAVEKSQEIGNEQEF